MKKKRVLKIIDFTSLSDLFMLLSILFLILYSINSLRTGVVAIAEREKAKKEINEIKVKANLLKINSKDLKGQKAIEKKIRELGNLEKKAAVIKNEQQKLMEIAIDREMNIKEYRELVENSLAARNLMQFEMQKEQKANEALQFQNDILIKQVKITSKRFKKQDQVMDTLKVAIIDKNEDLDKNAVEVKKQSITIKSFDKELAAVEKDYKVTNKEVKNLRAERKVLKQNLNNLNQVIAEVQKEQSTLAKNLSVTRSKKAFQEYTAKKRLKEIRDLEKDLASAKKSFRNKMRTIASVNSLNANLGQKLAKTHKELLYQQHLARNRLW